MNYDYICPDCDMNAAIISAFHGTGYCCGVCNRHIPRDELPFIPEGEWVVFSR